MIREGYPTLKKEEMLKFGGCKKPFFQKVLKALLRK